MKRAWAFIALLLAGCASGGHPPISYTDTEQGRIHVDDGGVVNEHLPIIFVHGNGASLVQWGTQLDYFRKTRRAIAFDLRGMGISDAPANGDYTIDAMAGDIQTIADSLHLDRFVLVGHSFGCAVVARYAALHPDRVAGVVYADGAGDLNMRPEAADKFLTSLRMDQKEVLHQWFEPILKNASETVKSVVFASAEATSGEALTGALESLADFPMLKNVKAYRGPKLAIVSSDIESRASLHMQMPDLPVRKMGGVSHWLMMDRPAEFSRLVALFLQEIEKQG